MRTKISTSITVNLALVDESGAPVTAWTYAAGDIKILSPGAAAWANVTNSPTQTTLGGSRGDWQIVLTSGEVGATPGELLVLVYKSGAIAMRRRSIDVEAVNPGELLAGAITAAAIAAGAITSAKFATGAIDANAVADGAIDSGAIADGSITAAKLAGNAITSAKIATGALTANAFATDAIPGAAIAADAVVKVQTGLATASAVQSVQDDTNDIQARLPAALVGGRMDASVGAMAANVVTAAAVATGAIDADALAGDAGTEIAAAVDVALSTAHGAGAWGGSGGATAGEIADAICDEALAGHATAGTVGAALTSLLSGVAAIPNAAANASAAATAVWAAVAEGGHSFGDYIRIAIAALVGRHTGTTGANVFYSPVATTTPRVTGTVASDGTRGNPTINGA